MLRAVKPKFEAVGDEVRYDHVTTFHSVECPSQAKRGRG